MVKIVIMVAMVEAMLVEAVLLIMEIVDHLEVVVPAVVGVDLADDAGDAGAGEELVRGRRLPGHHLRVHHGQLLAPVEAGRNAPRLRRRGRENGNQKDPGGTSDSFHVNPLCAAALVYRRSA